MDNAALRPKIAVTGEWRTLTEVAGFDSLTVLPAIGNFAPNPGQGYDFARVYVDAEFGDDLNANVDLRFATGVDVTKFGEVAPNQEAKGWIVVPALMFGITTADALSSVETKQEFQTPNLTEGSYGIDVPVNGQDLWVSVSGVEGYSYALGWTVRVRLVWFNSNSDIVSAPYA